MRTMLDRCNVCATRVVSSTGRRFRASPPEAQTRVSESPSAMAAGRRHTGIRGMSRSAHRSPFRPASEWSSRHGRADLVRRQRSPEADSTLARVLVVAEERLRRQLAQALHVSTSQHDVIGLQRIPEPRDDVVHVLRPFAFSEPLERLAPTYSSKVLPCLYGRCASSGSSTPSAISADPSPAPSPRNSMRPTAVAPERLHGCVVADSPDARMPSGSRTSPSPGRGGRDRAAAFPPPRDRDNRSTRRRSASRRSPSAPPSPSCGA